MVNTPAQTAQVMAEPTEVELQESFIELVAEQFGYKFGRKAKQKEMNEATVKERKAANEARKAVVDGIEALIKNPSKANATAVGTKREALEEAKKVLKAARKPFNAKIKPLGDAIKYIENVAIPDSLKELGHTVVPRFSLSDWAQKAVEQSKRQN